MKGLKVRAMYSYDYTENSNKIFKKKFNLYNYDSDIEQYMPVVVNSPSSVKKREFRVC